MIGIIHMGAAKTGSSTLQEFFHLNRERLRDAGVFYPRSPGAKQHGLLAEACIDPAREPGVATAERNRVFRDADALFRYAVRDEVRCHRLAATDKARHRVKIQQVR